MDGYYFYADKPSEKYHKSDIWLLISIFLLWGFGIFALFICSQNYALKLFNNAYHFVFRQLVCSGVGFVLFLILFLIYDTYTVWQMCFSIVLIVFFIALK